MASSINPELEKTIDVHDVKEVTDITVSSISLFEIYQYIYDGHWRRELVGNTDGVLSPYLQALAEGIKKQR